MDVDSHDLLNNTIPLETEQAQLSSPAQLIASGRVRRNYRVPKRFEDVPPTPAPPVEVPIESEHSRLPRAILIVRDRLVTAANKFGLWCDYPRMTQMCYSH